MCTRPAFHKYRSLIIVLAGLYVAGCTDSSPTKPSRLTPIPIAAVDVVGPDQVFSGESVQFVANVRQADGTTKSAMNMTGLRWRSSNPWVMSVSNSGLVTASGTESGEAVITAEVTGSSAPAQGTHTVRVQPAVTAALGITKQGGPGQTSYAFAVTLTDASNVPSTITAIWITFDEGWGGQCGWTSSQLPQSRLSASGTLVLDPLTCDDFQDEAVSVLVSIELKNDKGHTTQIYEYRAPVIG